MFSFGLRNGPLLYALVGVPKSHLKKSHMGLGFFWIGWDLSHMGFGIFQNSRFTNETFLFGSGFQS